MSQRILPFSLRVIAVSGFLLCASHGAIAETMKMTSGNSDDESGVIRAALMSIMQDIRQLRQSKSPITVHPFTLSLTIADSDRPIVAAESPRLREDTLTSFCSRNSKSYQVDKAWLCHLNSMVIPTDEQISALKLRSKSGESPTSREFREVIPKVGVMVRFSRPGVDEAGQQAMISLVVSDCSGNASIGWWGTYLMEKAGGKWTVVGTIGSPLVQ